MKFKVKDLDIASGGILVIVMNQDDALALGLHHGDRIGVSHKKRHAHAIVDIAESERSVPKGSLGLFEEVLDYLGCRKGSTVNVVIERKPKSIKLIREKLEGRRLKYEELKEIMTDLVKGKLSPVELTYFVAASAMRGLDEKETVDLTRAMIETGDRLEFPGEIVLDKHCTGGVAGNRTTPLIVPIIAAAGLKIPKTSSRAITSPAGTADTMEVLAPVVHTKEKMEQMVHKVGGCVVWGGAINLAPADDKIIQVESPLSIDAEGQLLASILAKKGSVGSTHVLIDIPLGQQTKIASKKKAKHLASLFRRIGKKLGMHIEVILTDGNEPIGNGIGPALEAKDVLKVLQRSDTRPLDLEEKSVVMAGKMFEMAKVTNNGRKLAQQILDDGRALKKFQEILKAQGGNSKIHSSDIKIGKHMYEYKAPKKGKIKDLNNKAIAKVAKLAGAPHDLGAGIYLHLHEGDVVKKGQCILTIHAENKEKLVFAKKELFSSKAVTFK